MVNPEGSKLPMSFHLRVATEEDVPSIRALIARSVRELQVQYTPAQREAAIQTVFSVDSRLIADATYFIAFNEEGQLAGCGGWSRRKTLYGGDHQVETIEPALLDPAIDAAKIRAIFVDPEFTRQGVGTKVLTAAEKAARAAGFERFEMGSTLAGVALYRLAGYIELSKVMVPVGSNEAIEVVLM